MIMHLVKIDTDKLRALIKNQGMNMTSFGSSIAHESSFIPKCLKRGSMQMHDILMIKQMYETDVELRQPISEPQIVKVKQMSLDDMNSHHNHRARAYYYGLLDKFESVYDYMQHIGIDEDMEHELVMTTIKGLHMAIKKIERLIDMVDEFKCMEEDNE